MHYLQYIAEDYFVSYFSLQETKIRLITVHTYAFLHIIMAWSLPFLSLSLPLLPPHWILLLFFSVCTNIHSLITTFFSFVPLPPNQYSVRFFRIISFLFQSFCMQFSSIFVHFNRKVTVQSSRLNLPSSPLFFIVFLYFIYCIRS